MNQFSGMNMELQQWAGGARVIDLKVSRKIASTLAICYTDRNGIRTKRTIDVIEFGPYLESGLIVAHCRLRNDTRSFVADRITACVDVETGEYIQDVSRYLLRRYQETPDYTVDWLRSDGIDVLKTLLYFGKASGALRSAKRVLMRDFCRDLSDDHRLSDQALDALFQDIAVPSLSAFRLAVGRLNAQPTILKVAVFCCMNHREHTSKTVYPAECDALNYVYKKWKL